MFGQSCMIRFRCSKCGKKLKAEEEIIGRKVRCSRCENVETVPPTDNLAKPFAKPENSVRSDDESESTDLTDSIEAPIDDHLQVVKPKSKTKRTKSRKSFGADSDEPVPELFGHSGAKSDPAVGNSDSAVGNIPKFNVVEKKKKRFNFGRWIIPAIATAVGLGLTALVTYFVISSRYTEPTFAAEFEALEEVKFYQRWHVELEKSRIKMSIMSKAFQSASIPGNSFTATFDELNSSADKYTNNSKSLVKEAAELYAKGKDVHAKSLLVTTAREMKDLRDEIDNEVGEFNQKINR